MDKLAARAQTFLSRFRRSDGQTMAEYAVILGVITGVILLALVLLSGNIGSVLNRVADLIK
jgi:Flp pilus assembly pilin Flp